MAPRRKPTFHPCLPPQLIEKFKLNPNIVLERSHVFTTFQEEFRQMIMKLGPARYPVDAECCVEVLADPRRPQFDPSTLERPEVLAMAPPYIAHIHVLSRKLRSWSAGEKRTWLHYAASTGDLVLAHEMIRMAVDIDHKDHLGVTALIACLVSLCTTKCIQTIASEDSLRFLGSCDNDLHRAFSNTRDLAKLLIEQHADVNTSALDVSPLSLAAVWQEWELVELLLVHGANPLSPDSIQFYTTQSKTRYASMVSEVKQANPRPPRPCPCWSGRLVRDCHGAGDVPYPDNFLCMCGIKGRTYEECCKYPRVDGVTSKYDRISDISETWYEEEGYIIQTYRQKVGKLDGALNDLLVKSGFTHEEIGYSYVTALAEGITPDMVEVYKSLLLAESGGQFGGDPAFWYAVEKVKWIPHYDKGHWIKGESKGRMLEWNDAVDHYIRHTSDTRSTLEIEIEVKIGMDGGPLYKKCISNGCGRTGERGVPVSALKRCSACETAYYCSNECQKQDWKGPDGHKTRCASGKELPQLNKTQFAMKQTWTKMETCFASIT